MQRAGSSEVISDPQCEFSCLAVQRVHKLHTTYGYDHPMCPMCKAQEKKRLATVASLRHFLD